MNLENNMALVPVSQATLAVLHAEAEARQLPNVPALLDFWAASLKAPGRGQGEPAAAAVALPAAAPNRRGVIRRSPAFAKAIALAQALPSGEHFSLWRLLPTEADWEGLERELRSPFGRKFRHEIEKMGIAVYVSDDDGETGAALYKRL